MNIIKYILLRNFKNVLNFNEQVVEKESKSFDETYEQ